MTATIALATITKATENLSINQQKLSSYINHAGQKNADIVVFPEFALYFLGKSTPSDRELLLHPIQEACRKNKIWCIAPTNFLVNKTVHNQAYLIDRNGTISGFVEKHYGYYDSYISNNYPVFVTDFGKIGIVICYDLGFDEPVRALANKGAEIIFAVIHYGAETEGDQAQFVKCLPFARAFEHKVFVCAVNVALRFPYACISSPRKKVVEYQGKKEQLVVGEIDLDTITESRTMYWNKSLVHKRDVNKYKWLRDNPKKEMMIFPKP